MLAVTQLVGFGVGYGPIAMPFIGTAGYETTAASHTYSSVSIGTESPDRIVLVCVAWNISGTCSLNSATIGGNSATIIGQCFATRNNQGIALCRLLVPTGKTADIVVNYSGSPLRGEIAVYNVTGYTSATP